MKRICAAADCFNDSLKNKGLSFFRFPKEQKRCQEWIRLCGRHDLADKDSEFLYKYYTLCSFHFDKSMLIGGAKCRLRFDAVPKLFPKKNKKKSNHNTDINSNTKSTVEQNVSQASVDVTAAAASTAVSSVVDNNNMQMDTTTATTYNDGNNTTMVKMPVYLYVSSPLDETLQREIKSLVGYNNNNNNTTADKTNGKTDTFISNITGEQFQKLCDMLTSRNIIRAN